ncbi:endonuclease/exonuclease/phosphatase family protein [Sphingomonas sp. AOB5]|uniref:endonuclease/exonuclease/phosphatase family protein n=1 Tax=Sphingomonas sp. AOB5 TaxID=3034017 RepID=UPI0023F7246D|nr:endonuclease/exonuclease/phosphatase family protein [Sphingomonas sp. AOB5]MDF7774266.1 endonuclease/exonuclease/phosphatase family protein [Sphingomonas sp. AOB5]
MKFGILITGLSLALGGCAHLSIAPSTRQAPDLKVVSWNLEFLAERDGAGCKPRTAADYAQMRQIADSLNADVIAFQEAENPAAAARVFDPSRYTIIMETRLGDVSGKCGGRQPEQTFIRQAVGFAIRKDLAFDRAADLTALQVGNPNLRSGVDITVRPAGGRPLRLLAVHLKSGCFSGSTGPACDTLAQQVPVLEDWIDAAARGDTRFVVLGDWNRRLAVPGDAVWIDLDDGDPADSDLTLADDGVVPRCDPRFTAFIDHIVLDRRSAVDFRRFSELTYATANHPSDHCPISAVIAR